MADQTQPTLIESAERDVQSLAIAQFNHLHRKDQIMRHRAVLDQELAKIDGELLQIAAKLEGVSLGKILSAVVVEKPLEKTNG